MDSNSTPRLPAIGFESAFDESIPFLCDASSEAFVIPIFDTRLFDDLCFVGHSFAYLVPDWGSTRVCPKRVTTDSQVG